MGAIRGTVTDSSGAAVPGASVTITDQQTGNRRSAATGATGEYEFTALPSGSYRVEIAAKGFNTIEISNVALRTSETARVDGRLEVGRTSETVVVQAEAPMVQVDNPTIQDTLNNQQITELPRDSRDFQSFLYLNPPKGRATGRSSSWARRATARASRWTGSARTAVSSARPPAASRRWKRSAS